MERAAYYMVELERPEGGWGQLPQMSTHARQVSEQMKREGIRVRFLRSIFVPEDESCLCLYEAASPDAVRQAARRAGLAIERVSKAFTEEKGTPEHPDVTVSMAFEPPRDVSVAEPMREEPG
jgi:hypothetical protein